MTRLSARVERGNMDAPFAAFYRFAEQKIERAALRATDRAVRTGVSRLRSEMAGARLGRLGQAIGATSDEVKGQGVFRFAGGWSASGVAFVRSKSERTLGALEAYTRGAAIRPVRSLWLWIPSNDVQRLVGSGANRRRLTPALWSQRGLDRKIGPLQQIEGENGYPLLVVNTGAVAMSGRARSLRGRTKKGLAPKGYVNRDTIVAFIGIPYTNRAARADPSAIFRRVQAQLPELFNREMARS